MFIHRKLVFYPLLAVLLVLSTAATPFQAGPQANPVVLITQLDTSQFPKVTAYISITDQAGEPVQVDPQSLVIKENGQVIAAEKIEGKGEVGPLTTMLAIDVSGSMLSGKKLQIAKTVAKDYINQMRPNDQAGIISFSHIITVVKPVTGDHQALMSAVDGLQATGDTAMYDALFKAIASLNPLPGRKAIIILTDGMDNRSSPTPDQVIQAIGTRGLSISTVGLGVPNQGAGNVTALDEKSLTSLAEKAGGRYGFANDQVSLQQLYAQYSRALKSEYVLTYTSPSTLKDGLSRSLTVSLTANGVTNTSNNVLASYNPGGLVPEIGGPAPWTMFFILLAGLLLLLLAPIAVSRLLHLLPAAAKAAPAKKGRIKLK